MIVSPQLPTAELPTELLTPVDVPPLPPVELPPLPPVDLPAALSTELPVQDVPIPVPALP